MLRYRMLLGVLFAVAVALLSVSSVARAQPAPLPPVPLTPAPLPPARSAVPVVPIDAPERCVPGAQTACACGGGIQGFQTCADDGARFAACVCAQPPPPRGASIAPLTFLSYRGTDSYTVQVGPQRCVTPCTLLVPAGPGSLHATGSGDIDAQFVMPHLSSQLRLQHDASGAYVIPGAVLVPTGIVVAASMWTIALACNGDDETCVIANLSVWPVLGAAMMTTGIVLLAVSGKHRPPGDANRPEILDASKEPPIRLTGIGLAPTSRGAVGGLGFAF